MAGLKRFGLAERITEVLDPMICLPAVGQGVLAIEARADDEEIAELLADLEDADIPSTNAPWQKTPMPPNST